MKERLTIVEIDYHSEVLRNLIQLVSKANYGVQVITTQKVWGKTGLNEEDFEVLFVDQVGVKKLIRLNISEINKSKAIIFNTLSSHYKLFAKQRFVPPVIVRIHNVNTAFLPPLKNYKPKFTLYFLWKDISHFVRREIFMLDYKWRKRFFSNVVDGFSFFSKQMERYVISEGMLEADRIISPNIPNAYFKEGLIREVQKEVTSFTVIGGIDIRRRNYDLLLDALEIVQMKTDQKIVVNLLGRPIGPYGTRIQKEIASIDSEHVKINIFKEFVTQEDFDKVLASTDYLINPLNEVTRHTIYTEYYGNTKVSGAINDMIQHGIPAFFPAFYQCVSGLEQGHISFENTSEGLAKELLCVISEDKSEEKGKKFAELYSLEVMIKQLQMCVLTLSKMDKHER